jgi:hypothetical protein
LTLAFGYPLPADLKADPGFGWVFLGLGSKVFTDYKGLVGFGVGFGQH